MFPKWLPVTSGSNNNKSCFFEFHHSRASTWISMKLGMQAHQMLSYKTYFRFCKFYLQLKLFIDLFLKKNVVKDH